MNHQHDHSYKLLFSEPRVVRDLLTGFVKEEWIDRLDLESLEKVSSTFVTDDLRDREGDVIWRVRFGDDWVYVYLLIEFQSTVDPFMALRIMTYVGLLYQELVKQKKLTSNNKLPPVLPIVLYNGERRWNAALNVSSLVQSVPGGLEHYRPDLPYLLLDEGAIVASEQWSIETQNVVSAIFRLEHHRNLQDAIDLIGLLVHWLQAPEQTRLRRHFALWVRRILLPSWVPENEGAEWQPLNDLNEVHNMLSERAKQWPDRWKQEGIEAGRQEGIEAGRQEGIEAGRQEGIEAGRQEGRRETARNMLERTSMDDQTIADLAELDVEQIRQLRDELQSRP